MTITTLHPDAQATRPQTPPAWVISGPDSEGSYDGPTGTVAGISVSSSWSPTEGARMWLDTVLHRDEDTHPMAAVALAELIERIARTVGPTQAEEMLARLAGAEVAR
jgi:hypothetical protein